MKHNKAYFPTNAIKLHEDFDVWYEDGDTFLTFQGSWEEENDKIRIFGRMGGEMGCIKPDPKALVHYLRLELWEYSLHTLRIFENYYIKGMRWEINGSLANPPLYIKDEDTLKTRATVRVRDFLDRGECYEVRVKDVETLRVAVAAIVAMGIKEEYKGLSEGLKNPDAKPLEKIKNWLLSDKGLTYEEILKTKKDD